MVTWLLAGVVIGAVAGSLGTWIMLRRRGPDAPPSPAQLPVELDAPAPAAASDEVRQVLAANQRALADLEDRYRDRKQATTPEDAPKRGGRRRPKAPPAP